MKLYSYCLRYDGGAAPNPFWGICTLAICKPVIRRTAKKDDWIVGLGSSDSPIGDISDCIVYAMQGTDKKTFEEYDSFCRNHYPEKIPFRNRQDYRGLLGDCIYDYTQGSPPRMRRGVHGEHNRARDLGGKSVLISDHFYYFGDKPAKLPDHLMPLIHRTQGHKSKANQPYLNGFVEWITGTYEANKLYGEPQYKKEFVPLIDIAVGDIAIRELQRKCSARDLKEDEADEAYGDD